MSALDDTESAVALRDGSSVLIRPGRPEDRELLLAGFERLGPESRYERFLAPMAELTDDIVTYLTDVDHHDHEALAAIDAETGDGVGVARFVRSADRPDTAEAALTVIDDWQGRGVGTLLLDRLAERAKAEGITHFTALLLAENREMLELLDGLGPVRVLDRQSGTVEVEAELSSVGAGPALHGVLGASARHALKSARLRRPARPEDTYFTYAFADGEKLSTKMLVKVETAAGPRTSGADFVFSPSVYAVSLSYGIEGPAGRLKTPLVVKTDAGEAGTTKTVTATLSRRQVTKLRAAARKAGKQDVLVVVEGVAKRIDGGNPGTVKRGQRLVL